MIKMDIVCNQTATLTVEVHVRHLCSLMFRNLKWMINEQPMPEPLLGCPIIEVLGLYTK